MSIYDAKQWIIDIDEVSKTIPELSNLAGKTVLITGATGLICSSVTDILIRYNETHKQCINIIIAGRNIERAHKRFGEFFNKEYFHFVEYDASKTNNRFDFKCDYIIHGASNASPSKISQEPVETMLSNFDGARCLLEYAKDQQIKRLLYISSSEVYGRKDGDRPYYEDDYGYVDLLNPRNSYAIGKRAAETLCISYWKEYNVNSVIVRPGHIYGPTASRDDNRVSSAWAYDVARGKDIVMKSSGEQVRSYCYCLDCASAILKVLLTGESGEAYNISNSDSMISIRELAKLYAKYGNVQVQYEKPQEIEKAAFNPMSNSSLNSNKLIKLGWKGIFCLDIGIKHTVAILKDCNNLGIFESL